jgi:hypothetical protein
MQQLDYLTELLGFQGVKVSGVCDKNIGKVDKAFYLPYNLIAYKAYSLRRRYE